MCVLHDSLSNERGELGRLRVLHKGADGAVFKLIVSTWDLDGVRHDMSHEVAQGGRTRSNACAKFNLVFAVLPVS